ncbi:DUF397 domain-containing protein [Streptomyces sp. SID1121]|uniref:DUF397 domain-containing protein n=1 Tax=Streptomyces sp. SID1121 TaxID=3425888 RepID=UPI00405780DE
MSNVHPDLSNVHWRKSSYSSGFGGECLEVSGDFPGLVPVRDSKSPGGPALTLTANAWAKFVTHLAR